jgi:hypothetical protein
MDPGASSCVVVVVDYHFPADGIAACLFRGSLLPHSGFVTLMKQLLLAPSRPFFLAVCFGRESRHAIFCVLTTGFDGFLIVCGIS